MAAPAGIRRFQAGGLAFGGSLPGFAALATDLAHVVLDYLLACWHEKHSLSEAASRQTFSCVLAACWDCVFACWWRFTALAATPSLELRCRAAIALGVIVFFFPRPKRANWRAISLIVTSITLGHYATNR